MKYSRIVSGFFITVFFFACTKEEVNETQDAIVGQWFLTLVNDTDVADLDCYKDSYIESDGETITFYVLDRLEDGSCQLLLDSTSPLSVIDDFYYLGEEAIEIYIENRELTWRVDTDTTLVFQK